MIRIPLRFLAKEASLLGAFVVLGCLLLLLCWITHNVHQSFVREFKNSQISVVLKEGTESRFRDLVEKNQNVVRFEIYSAARNKERLSEMYPELKGVVSPLEEKFFPVSSVVTVLDADAFLKTLAASPDLFQSQLLHKPPETLKNFLDLLLLVFSLLWVMTLALVLYFNLERLTLREEARWSLLKMLGAKPSRIFMPLLYGQVARVTLASIFAMLFALFFSHRVELFFSWNWVNLPGRFWLGFFLVSMALTGGLSFWLFTVRYRRISIG